MTIVTKEGQEVVIGWYNGGEQIMGEPGLIKANARIIMKAVG